MTHEDPLDDLCWFVCNVMEENYPPEEAARGCIDYHRNHYREKHIPRKTAQEIGWHQGTFLLASVIAERLARTGVDVAERANRVQAVRGQEPFDIPDEVDLEVDV